MLPVTRQPRDCPERPRGAGSRAGRAQTKREGRREKGEGRREKGKAGQELRGKAELWHVSVFPCSGCPNKSPQPERLNCHSGSWNSKVKASARLVSPEASLFGLQMAVLSPRPLSAHMSVSQSPFYKDTGQDEIGTHPYVLSLPLLHL